MKEKEIRYKYLLNCLALFSADYRYLISIDSPTFDIEFELPSELEIGLSIDNIDYLRKQDLINEKIRSQILAFRENILAVPDIFWTVAELETNRVWDKIRDEGNNILDNLGIPPQNRLYDFSVVRIV